MSALAGDESAFALHPRLAADTIAIAALDLSELRLMDDARFPWLILVPRRAGATGLLDLNDGEQATLLHEIRRCANALQRLHAPTRINIAMIGNLVPQLHAHVIARFDGDAAWPKPVWGFGQTRPYRTDERESTLAAIRNSLGG